MSTTKRLVVNATSGEYIVAASNANEAISPTNIKISRETSFGIADVKPVRAGPAILFAQRKGKNDNPSRRLRELVYNFQTDSYAAPDLTILSEHITHPGLVQGAYVASPDLMIWYARTDGARRGDDLRARPAGGRLAPPRRRRQRQGAQALASIPGGEGDELWMIVERYIDGL